MTLWHPTTREEPSHHHPWKFRTGCASRFPTNHRSRWRSLRQRWKLQKLGKGELKSCATHIMARLKQGRIDPATSCWNKPKWEHQRYNDIMRYDIIYHQPSFAIQPQRSGVPLHKSQTQRLKPNKSAVGNFPVSIFYQQIEFFPAQFFFNRFWELNQKKVTKPTKIRLGGNITLMGCKNDNMMWF